MNKYFEDKAHQTNCCEMTAFGISISSRHFSARELSEMLLFTQELARSDVHEYVNSVFYDSNADLCCIEPDDIVKKGGEIALKIEAAANTTITQFELFGYIGHGFERVEEIVE